MPCRVVEIAGRWVGEGRPCLIIAEAGVNHNGDVAAAHALVEAAVTARADAVKFQTFVPERTVTVHAPKAEYQRRTTDPGQTQLEMLRGLALSRQAHAELSDTCGRKGILFLSSPFDEDSADFLDKLGVPAFKIPSGEITNLPFLRHVARKGKPIIMSTGMSTLAEVQAAVLAVLGTGNRNVILLHCVSAYPAEPEDANLRAIRTLADAFAVPVGFSDHSLGMEVALAAVALGACVLEKHLTLGRHLAGPDQQASMEPNELCALVRGVRTVEAALGHGRKEPVLREADTARVARKSIVAACHIPAGTSIRRDHLAVKCPGTGLPPAVLDTLLNRVAKEDIPVDAVVTLEMLVSRQGRRRRAPQA